MGVPTCGRTPFFDAPPTLFRDALQAGVRGDANRRAYGIEHLSVGVGVGIKRTLFEGGVELARALYGMKQLAIAETQGLAGVSGEATIFFDELVGQYGIQTKMACGGVSQLSAGRGEEDEAVACEPVPFDCGDSARSNGGHDHFAPKCVGVGGEVGDGAAFEGLHG